MKDLDCKRSRFQLFFLLFKAPFPGAESRHSFATRFNFSFRFQTRGLMNNQLDLSQDSISCGVRNVMTLRDSRRIRFLSHE